MSESKIYLQFAEEQFSIGEDFLKKYNRPGPRYTSYPTAPVWQDNFGPADMETTCRDADKKAAPVSLYFHIPFSVITPF